MSTSNANTGTDGNPPIKGPHPKLVVIIILLIAILIVLIYIASVLHGKLESTNIGYYKMLPFDKKYNFENIAALIGS